MLLSRWSLDIMSHHHLGVNCRGVLLGLFPLFELVNKGEKRDGRKLTLGFGLGCGQDREKLL